MKRFVLTIFLLILVSVGINAHEFHPYKVKSGKITFEKRKYSMHAMLQLYPKATVVAEESVVGKMVKHYMQSESRDYTYL